MKVTTEYYINKYLKEEWVIVNPSNGATVKEIDFIPHFFKNWEECVIEAKIASQHLSHGYYYAFEPVEDLFSWVRANVMGKVSGYEISQVIKLARKNKRENKRIYHDQ